MSKIFTAALGVALLLGVSGVAGAQGQSGRGSGRDGSGMRQHGPGRGHFVKDLNLTDAQKAQIKAIHEKYKPQFQALHSQFRAQTGVGGSIGKRDSARVRQRGDSARRSGRMNIPPELRQKMVALRQQEQTQIRNVLTAEQRTKFDAGQAQRKKWMENRGNRKERGKPALRG